MASIPTNRPFPSERAHRIFSLLQGAFDPQFGHLKVFPTSVVVSKLSCPWNWIGDGNQVFQLRHCSSIRFNSLLGWTGPPSRSARPVNAASCALIRLALLQAVLAEFPSNGMTNGGHPHFM
ncbi:hypothetical protein [Hydrogenophaga palleronii]|uniref:hypothetical protein n=1 Tax=Hydrogenophaga palleronii TaxID=65655 RepID=UPI000A79ABD9|nr:hypothetical protein [Hydrogenophaga palleronii]